MTYMYKKVLKCALKGNGFRKGTQVDSHITRIFFSLYQQNNMKKIQIVLSFDKAGP